MRIITILIVLVLSVSTVMARPTIVQNLRYNRIGDKIQLVLDINHPTQFEQFSLPNPPRIVLDFPNTERKGRAGLTINQGSVASIRTGYRDNTTLRVVIDLLAAAKANIYLLKPEGKRGNRVVIDVYDFDTNPALSLTSLDENMPNVIFAGKALDDQSLANTANYSTNKIISPSPPTTIRITPSVIEQRQISPKGVVKAKTTVKNPSVNKANIVICLDPGHGGKDPGAMNPILGTREKDVVLAIAHRLRRILANIPGYKVVMTRNKDVFIPLYERPKKCRAQGADLFVSIHADAVERGEPSGSSVYILSTRGASSQLAKYLAKNENAVDLKWGVDTSKYDNDIQQALFNIQQEATLESSNVLAKRTISQLERIGNVHKSKVERANFVVLRSPEIPSMLVETGFISNTSEARLLSTANYQDKVARGIAAGITDYFREHLPQHLLLEK